MEGTYLEVNLRKITENSARIREICDRHGMQVLAVTKGFAAIPEIVRAISDGGIDRFADSRLMNIKALREHGFANEMTLLRIPMISLAAQTVNYADLSLNSEYAVMKALSEAAVAAGKLHRVILMVELGDLREGMLPLEAIRTCRKAAELPGIRIAGVGTNMGCYGGILPTRKNLSVLRLVADAIRHETGLEIPIVSGGGTSSLKLVYDGTMPPGINQLRIGEGLLLGTDTTRGDVIPWLKQDAFTLRAEIVEIKNKPSKPIGESGRDAFGNIPVFEDEGIIRRAIVAVGKQDVQPSEIIPLDPGIRVLGASSDHTILNISNSENHYRVGDRISFRLSYAAMLTLCTSGYISKKMLRA